MEIAVSIAQALAVVLIDRVPRTATRDSAPTWSTPGRPCRKARKAASERVTSRYGARGSRRGGIAAAGASGSSTWVMPGILPCARRGSTSLTRSECVPARWGPVTPAATVSRVQLTVVDHPLARARLTRMRDERTDNAAFRAALAELTQMLVYEATRDLPVAEEPITTPVTGTTGYRLAAPPLIVPVLRAGLGRRSG